MIEEAQNILAELLYIELNKIIKQSMSDREILYKKLREFEEYKSNMISTFLKLFPTNEITTFKINYDEIKDLGINIEDINK